MQEEFLYHGSPDFCNILKPHQAYDTGFAAGCQNAVYATTNKDMAICFAMGSVPDKDGEVEREMMPEHGNIMIFKKGTPNYGAKGYVYKLDKKDFQHAMGTQWVCFHEVKPIEIMEIEVNNYLHLCKVEN